MTIVLNAKCMHAKLRYICHFVLFNFRCTELELRLSHNINLYYGLNSLGQLPYVRFLLGFSSYLRIRKCQAEVKILGWDNFFAMVVFLEKEIDQKKLF